MSCSREFAGRFDAATGKEVCPQLLTHYAVMNAQEECMDRSLPEAIVVYHLYLKLVHSGYTAEQLLALDDKPFGQFVGEAFQITCDAGLVPYEKDFVPGLALSFSKGFTLAAVASEDIVSFLVIIPPPHLLTFLVARACHCASSSWTGGPPARWG